MTRTCALRGLSENECEKLLNGTPFFLAEGLSGGEAEEFVGLLKRECVEARMHEVTATD